MANVGIIITSRSAVRVAPEAIIFEVDLSSLSGFVASAPTGDEVYDARYHEIEYFWDFYYSGADNSYLFSAPVNIYDGDDAWANGYRNSRYAFGFQAAHVFREPGIYTVQLSAYEPQSGTVAYATQSVSIGDPDTLFSGTNTIFLSPSGDFKEAPPGALQVTSSNIGSAYSTYVAGQESAPKRIMLSRGETFTNFNLKMGRNTDTPTCHIVAAPGPGAKPTVKNHSGDALDWDDKQTTSGIKKDLVVQNVILNGSFDSRVNTAPDSGDGRMYNCIAWQQMGANPPQMALFDGCECYDLVTFCESPRAKYVCINDTIIEGYSYGATMFEPSAFAVLGSRIMSRTDALVNATEIQGWALRIGPCDTIVWACDMYTRQDWFGSSPHNGQPCIRFNADQDVGTRINCHACCFEAYYFIVQVYSSGSPDRGRAVNGLFRSNYLIGTFQTAMGFQFASGGVSIANNIMSVPPAANETHRYRDLESMLWLDDRDGESINLASPIRFYQNTMVSHASSDAEYSPGRMEMSYITDFSDFRHLTIENNINHQPNLDTPVTIYAPLSDNVNAYFAPRELGYLDSFLDDRTNTASMKTAGVTDLYDPQTGSSAIGAASMGLNSWRDFRGLIRSEVLNTLSRSTQSMGAIEPHLES